MAKIASFAKAVTEAKAKIKDPDTLKATFPAIGKECGGCHETYPRQEQLDFSSIKRKRAGAKAPFAFLAPLSSYVGVPGACDFAGYLVPRAKSVTGALFASCEFVVSRLRSYFVTWPRISPPGLAAVWMLT